VSLHGGRQIFGKSRRERFVTSAEIGMSQIQILRSHTSIKQLAAMAVIAETGRFQQADFVIVV